MHFTYYTYWHDSTQIINAKPNRHRTQNATNMDAVSDLSYEKALKEASRIPTPSLAILSFYKYRNEIDKLTKKNFMFDI